MWRFVVFVIFWFEIASACDSNGFRECHGLGTTFADGGDNPYGLQWDAALHCQFWVDQYVGMTGCQSAHACCNGAGMFNWWKDKYDDSDCFEVLGVFTESESCGVGDIDDDAGCDSELMQSCFLANGLGLNEEPAWTRYDESEDYCNWILFTVDTFSTCGEQYQCCELQGVMENRKGFYEGGDCGNVLETVFPGDAGCVVLTTSTTSTVASTSTTSGLMVNTTSTVPALSTPAPVDPPREEDSDESESEDASESSSREILELFNGDFTLVGIIAGSVLGVCVVLSLLGCGGSGGEGGGAKRYQFRYGSQRALFYDPLF